MILNESNIKNRLLKILNNIRCQTPTIYRFLPFLLLFIFSFIFLFWLQPSQTFADPDSFYHAKIVWMMEKKISEGKLPIFKQFPWLYYTVLRDGYIDHHFLYHLLSVPFIILTQLLFKLPFFSRLSIVESYKILIGFKFVTIFWSALFITIFYLILKKLKIKCAVFYPLLLLITGPFVFRLSLGKATASSLIFLFFGIYFCCDRDDSERFQRRFRRAPLFSLSFFYVWLYGGWPLMPVAAMAWIISKIISNIKYPIFNATNFQIPNFKLQTNSKFKINLSANGKEYFKLLLAVSGGLAAGLVINPYFPKNLTFYYHQIYQIAILNYKNILNIGGEWYHYNFFELLAAGSITFILTIPALVFFAGNLFHYFKKYTIADNGKDVAAATFRHNISTLLFSFILATISLILTLKSRRNVEYFFPFLIFFIAISFNLAIKNFYNKREILKNIIKILNKKWLLAGIIGGFFAVVIPYIIWRDLSTVKFQLTNGFSWNKWRAAGEWLKNNVEPQEIIFHDDWDDWSFLFFHNDKNYYIVGLDPTFMYIFNKDLYYEWSDATLGKNTIPLNNLITKKFNSKYILVDNEHFALERRIINDGKFERVFNGGKTKIYKIIQNSNVKAQNYNAKP